ncbi:GGDEF domain-containing protein [Allohahella marinimesophila]|uniref:diguanylate cyclase n=1 Tax=Allohahella marinimesophila TaxID=1054972 RepID=A0ABP7PLW3_9GAMM
MITGTETSRFQGVKRRLQSNYKLSLIMGLSVFAFVGIGPIILFRLFSGNIFVAIVDLILMLTVTGAAIYAWMTDNIEPPAVVLALMVSGGLVVMIPSLGAPGLYWYFAMVVFNFGMLRAKWALLLNVVAMGMVLFLSELSTYDETIPFVMSALATFGFTFIIIYRSDMQRSWLEQTSLTDSLTGIGNRRALDQELELVFAHYQRFGIPFGLLLLDLDHFKHVNDTAGHDAGDAALKDFTELMSESLRKEDRLFRYGGEEFVLVLANVQHDNMLHVATVLCRLVADELKSPADNAPITVSIGASLLRPNDDAERWIQRADKALYAAKAGGRNQVVMFEDIEQANS